MKTKFKSNRLKTTYAVMDLLSLVEEQKGYLRLADYILSDPEHWNGEADDKLAATEGKMDATEELIEDQVDLILKLVRENEEKRNVDHLEESP